MEHLDVGHHLYKPERESDYDIIIAKWAETCKIISGDYVKSAAPSTTELTAEPAHSPSLKGGLGFEEGKKVYQIFSTSAVLFARDFLTSRGNR